MKSKGYQKYYRVRKFFPHLVDFDYIGSLSPSQQELLYDFVAEFYNAEYKLSPYMFYEADGKVFRITKNLKNIKKKYSVFYLNDDNEYTFDREFKYTTKSSYSQIQEGWKYKMRKLNDVLNYGNVIQFERTSGLEDYDLSMFDPESAMLVRERLEELRNENPQEFEDLFE